MFLPQEIIRQKRDKQTLSSSDIHQFIKGVARAEISDSQLGAFAMAVYLNGMTIEERIALTLAMRDSGKVLTWDLPGPVLDKHSTGGVGDLVSLVLGPIIAACGGYVPMIAGRGLGHTGGTIDKLESIPGYDPFPSVDTFKKVVRDIGIAIIGQTGDLAVADKRMYATRDVTATVESIDLITASILSKKLAAGLEALVMDIKVGNGAVMTEMEDSRALAQSIVKVANGAGTKTSVLITDMNQSLARNAGNALEIKETVEFLLNVYRDPQLEAVTVALAVQMLLTSGLAKNETDATEKVQRVLDNGEATERFAKMIAALGGPSDFVERYEDYLTISDQQFELPAPSSGYVSTIDCHQLGLCVVKLGGGRIHPEHKIDHSVGFSHIKKVGESVQQGEPLLTVHANSEKDFESIQKQLQNCFSISAQPVASLPAVYEIIEE